MTQPPNDEPTASSPEELREQVEQTRSELGETVEALAAKLTEVTLYATPWPPAS